MRASMQCLIPREGVREEGRVRFEHESKVLYAKQQQNYI